METIVPTKDAIRFEDDELRGFLDHTGDTFIPATEWPARLNRKEIKRMLSLAGVKTSDPATRLPVDHLIGDLKSVGSSEANRVIKALKTIVELAPGLIGKSETFDLRIDHRGFGFARVVQIHRRDNATGKTVRVDDFTGTSGLESVALAASFE